MRTALLLTVAVGLSAVAAPVPKELKKARPDDAEAILGDWVITHQDVGDGNGVQPVPVQNRPHTFTRTRQLVGNPNSPITVYGNYTLDQTTEPKRYLLTANGKLEPPIIYRLDGDTLTMCTSRSPDHTPSEFVGNKSQYVLVYQRVKE